MNKIEPIIMEVSNDIRKMNINKEVVYYVSVRCVGNNGTFDKNITLDSEDEIKNIKPGQPLSQWEDE